MESLEKVYENVEHPISLSGITKLSKFAKKKLNLDRKDVEDFLSKQDSFTLHKITRKNFQRRKIMVSKPGITVCVDTAYMYRYSKANDGNKYLIVFIDAFSRYARVFPCKQITFKEMKPIFQSFFDESIYSYKRLFTDAGSEFKNKQIQTLFNSYKIHNYSTYSQEIKSSIAERYIQTLKRKIYKYITHSNEENYIEKLSIIVDTYNKSPHSGILNKTPLEVHLMGEEKEIIHFSRQLYKSVGRRDKKSIPPQLYEGRVVKITSARRTQHPFHKGYSEQNTRELFKIKRVNYEHNPHTFTLSDLEDKPILGVFYSQELIPASDSGKYRIQVLKNRFKNKKKEYLIKYIDYPNSPTLWVEESQIVNID